VKSRVCSLVSGYDTVKSRVCSLVSGYDTVKSRVCSLVTGYDTVKSRGCSLVSGYDTVKSRRCSLVSGYDTPLHSLRYRSAAVRRVLKDLLGPSCELKLASPVPDIITVYFISSFH